MNDLSTKEPCVDKPKKDRQAIGCRRPPLIAAHEEQQATLASASAPRLLKLSDAKVCPQDMESVQNSEEKNPFFETTANGATTQALSRETTRQNAHLQEFLAHPIATSPTESIAAQPSPTHRTDPSPASQHTLSLEGCYAVPSQELAFCHFLSSTSRKGPEGFLTGDDSRRIRRDNPIATNATHSMMPRSYSSRRSLGANSQRVTASAASDDSHSAGAAPPAAVVGDGGEAIGHDDLQVHETFARSSSSRHPPPHVRQALEDLASSDYAAGNASDTQVDGSSVPDQHWKVVQDDDCSLLTLYQREIMGQLRHCRFTKKDRRGKRRFRGVVNVGWGGLECVHCCAAPSTAPSTAPAESRPRRFFWHSQERFLKDSFREIADHMTSCRGCPDATKRALLTLQDFHQKQTKMDELPRESRTVYLRRLWRRIHHVHMRVDDDSSLAHADRPAGNMQQLQPLSRRDFPPPREELVPQIQERYQ